MTDRLIIALAQLNPTLGAIKDNLARAREGERKIAGDSAAHNERPAVGHVPALDRSQDNGRADRQIPSGRGKFKPSGTECQHVGSTD